MNRLVMAIAPLILAATPAAAQHAGHGRPPAARPVPAPTPRPAPRPTPRPRPAAPPAAPAQDPHAGHAMPPVEAPATVDPHAGHDMPTEPQAADPHAGHDMTPTGQTSPAPAMPAGHDMSTMGQSQTPADPHAGHDMSGMAMPPDIQTSANNPGRPPETPPPAAASSGPTHAADLLFDPAEMAAAREQLRVENGDIRTKAVIIDRLEANFSDGEEGYTWNAQGWTGGDINRFWWKTEGEGLFGDGVEDAEVQALYSRAFRPFWDVQTGLRQTYQPEGDRTDLVVGVQGLAPYWFEVDAAAFLSNKGELTARGEVEYDQRITNRWILQPRAEINLSAEDIPELSIGSGLTSLQIGARLRYEIRKEFAPYVGVEWTRSFGNTADFLEADGRSSEDTRLVVGIRAWF